MDTHAHAIRQAIPALYQFKVTGVDRYGNIHFEDEIASDALDAMEAFMSDYKDMEICTVEIMGQYGWVLIYDMQELEGKQCSLLSVQAH